MPVLIKTKVREYFIIHTSIYPYLLFIEKVEELLKEGADINYTKSNRVGFPESPLLAALSSNSSLDFVSFFGIMK